MRCKTVHGQEYIDKIVETNWYENQYMAEIYEKPENFHITISQFLKWLHEDKSREKTFTDDLANVFNGKESMYYIAIDYSIPLVMVKWFLGY